MNEPIDELLAVYALGGVTEEEAQEIEAYLAAHPDAELQLRAMMETTAALAHLAPAVRPSPSMEEQLFARIAADAPKRVPAHSPQRAPRQSWLDMVRSWFAMPLVGGASVALAALVLVWALSLSRQITDLRQQASNWETQAITLETRVVNLQTENNTLSNDLTILTTQNDALQRDVQQLTAENVATGEWAFSLEGQLAALLTERDEWAQEYGQVQALNAALQNDLSEAQTVLTLFSSPDAYYVNLPGTESQPGAQAQMILDPDGQVAVLFVTDLEPLAAGQVYQVLLIRDDGHDTAETFAVGTAGKNALVVHAQAPFDTFTAIGVSVEPEGGSLQRTGEIILLGSIKS